MDIHLTLLTSGTSCHHSVYMSLKDQTLLILLNLINGTSRKKIGKQTYGHHSHYSLTNPLNYENHSITHELCLLPVSTKLAAEPQWGQLYTLWPLLSFPSLELPRNYCLV